MAMARDCGKSSPLRYTQGATPLMCGACGTGIAKLALPKEATSPSTKRIAMETSHSNLNELKDCLSILGIPDLP